jgi:hypothetical protein
MVRPLLRPHPSIVPVSDPPLPDSSAGKMEKSFVAYASRYPQAAPLPDMEGVQFNVDIMSPRMQQGPSPRFDGLERHGEFAESLSGGDASLEGAAGYLVREQAAGGVLQGLEACARSDSDGRCVLP